MTRSILLGLFLFLVAAAQQGGDDPWVWSFEDDLAGAGFSQEGGAPPVTAAADSAFGPAERSGGRVFNGRDDVLVAFERIGPQRLSLPSTALSVSAWVAIERPQRWGGLVSCVQDNGEAEKGFVLGHDEEFFTFGLATTGADDGDGKLTYLRGQTPWQPGRWHHVAAVFDGRITKLFVDGELDAETTEQHGRVLLDDDSPLVFGSYRDENEDLPLDGRMASARLARVAWSAEEVRALFERHSKRTELPVWTDTEFGFLVDPYLTWPTGDAVSVLFETTFPSAAKVRYRADDEPAGSEVVFDSATANLHECRLEGLRPDQKYFYSVIVEGPDGAGAESPLRSFRTAASADRAFTFVVIGDTQTNGDVAKRVSDLAFGHRPNLAVHAGDLVDTGTTKRDWTDVFFPSMQPLIGHVPLMSVLGNHERDADHYYRYMSLPEPERWYSFRYGDAEFFMLDGNRTLAERSEQLDWLESVLKASEATWRFAVLHQPPYTSDSNDYGDTTLEASQRGDMNVRNIVALLERYDVDICFSGHVHDYERTFPIQAGRVTPYEDGGVIYVTAAGGGGPLEDFDATNTWFGHKKAGVHHFVYVAIHAGHLELQAIDENGRLFDSLALEKRP